MNQVWCFFLETYNLEVSFSFAHFPMSRHLKFWLNLKDVGFSSDDRLNMVGVGLVYYTCEDLAVRNFLRSSLSLLNFQKRLR